MERGKKKRIQSSLNHSQIYFFFNFKTCLSQNFSSLVELQPDFGHLILLSTLYCQQSLWRALQSPKLISVTRHVQPLFQGLLWMQIVYNICINKNASYLDDDISIKFYFHMCFCTCKRECEIPAYLEMYPSEFFLFET